MMNTVSGWTLVKPAFVAVVLLGVWACAASRVPLSLGTALSHHTKNGFINPGAESRDRHGFGSVLKWQLGLGPKEIPPIPLEEIPPYEPDPVAPDLASIRNPDPGSIQVTWIGQSTFLIQVAGKNILTDPVFSERISPVSFAGPKRLAPPGIPLDALPRIDDVVISHDHFDHLDKGTILKLGNGPRYFAPLKAGDWLRRRGVERVSELDWGQTAFDGDVLFHCVGAQHFSGRGPFRFNTTLWAGWVIETGAGKIYFAGDSGYGPHFREIGERFGPMDLALIPIGAYRPRWFMQEMHLDPPEAVKVHRDVRSKRSIGMHWGTVRQTDEPLGEPPIYLAKAAREAGLADGEFAVLKFGQTIRVQN